MTEAKAHRWDELPVDHPMELLARQRVIGAQAMISRVVLEAGCDVPSHAHPNEQFAHVVSGRVRFVLGEPGSADAEELVLGAGDILHLPGGVPHAAFAIERCEILDIFAPPSETTGIDD
jgi:quercetin dioxygenase-like cupin family protein